MLNATIIITGFIIIIACLVLGFFALVLMGNLSAMKFLAKNGLAVFSNNIVTDCKLLNYVNKEGKCWLSISEVCYSPVMEYCEGKYKNHTRKRLRINRQKNRKGKNRFVRRRQQAAQRKVFQGCCAS